MWGRKKRNDEGRHHHLTWPHGWADPDFSSQNLSHNGVKEGIAPLILRWRPVVVREAKHNVASLEARRIICAKWSCCSFLLQKLLATVMWLSGNMMYWKRSKRDLGVGVEREIPLKSQSACEPEQLKWENNCAPFLPPSFSYQRLYHLWFYFTHYCETLP